MTDFNLGAIVAEFRVDDQKFNAALDAAEARVKAFEQRQASLRMTADVTRADTAIRQVASRAANTDARVTVTADTAAAARAVAAVASDQTATVQVAADVQSANRALNTVDNTVAGLDGASPTVTVDADTSSALSKLESLKEAMSPAALAAVAGAAGVGALIFRGAELDTARRELAARLALTGDERARIQQSAEGLYSSAQVEDLGAANSVIAGLITNQVQLRAATSATLKDLGMQVAAVARLGETETATVTRVASTLVQQGLAASLQQALDMIAVATQKTSVGMEGDLLEVTSEYAAMLKQLGITGPQALAAVAEASKLGPIGMDKWGDALKEFTIRSTNMSATSVAAFQKIGLNAQDMAGDFLAGGARSQQALMQVVDGLLAIPDPADRANTAIALFGAPLEDMGTGKIPAFLEGLRNSASGLGDFSGAAAKVVTELSGTESQLESLKRAGDVAASSLGAIAATALLPLLNAANLVLTPLGALAGLLDTIPDWVLNILGVGAFVGLAGKVATKLRGGNTDTADVNAAAGSAARMNTEVRRALDQNVPPAQRLGTVMQQQIGETRAQVALLRRDLAGALAQQAALRGTVVNAGPGSGTVVNGAVVGAGGAAAGTAAAGTAAAGATGLARVGQMLRRGGSVALGAVGGPAGLAVGAGIAGITALIDHFSSKAEEARKKSEEWRGALDQLKGTFDQASGSITEATKALLGSNLAPFIAGFTAAGLTITGVVDAIASGDAQKITEINKKFLDTLPIFDRVFGRNGVPKISNEASDTLTQLAKTTGRSVEDVTKALLSGDPAIRMWGFQLADAMDIDPSEASEKIQQVIDDIVQQYPELAAFRDQLKKTFEAQAEQAKKVNDNAAAAAAAATKANEQHAVSQQQVLDAMKRSQKEGKSLTDVFKEMGLSDTQIVALKDAYKALGVELFTTGDGQLYVSETAYNATQKLTDVNAALYDSQQGWDELRAAAEKEAGDNGMIERLKAIEDAAGDASAAAETLTANIAEALGLNAAADKIRNAKRLRELGEALTAPDEARKGLVDARRGLTDARGQVTDAKVAQARLRRGKDETDYDWAKRREDAARRVADAERAVLEAQTRVEEAEKAITVATEDRALAVQEYVQESVKAAVAAGQETLAKDGVDAANRRVASSLAASKEEYVRQAVASRRSGESAAEARAEAERLWDSYAKDAPKVVTTTITAKTADAKREGLEVYRVYNAAAKRWVSVLTTKEDAQGRANRGEIVQFWNDASGTYTATIDADTDEGKAKITKAMAAAGFRFTDGRWQLTAQVAVSAAVLRSQSVAQQIVDRGGSVVGRNLPALLRRATGGAVTGPGKGIDSVHALLAPGEHVLTASDVDALGGQDAVYRLRAALRSPRRMAGGGAVLPTAGSPVTVAALTGVAGRSRGETEGRVEDALAAIREFVAGLIDISRDYSAAAGEARTRLVEAQKAFTDSAAAGSKDVAAAEASAAERIRAAEQALAEARAGKVDSSGVTAAQNGLDTANSEARAAEAEVTALQRQVAALRAAVAGAVGVRKETLTADLTAQLAALEDAQARYGSAVEQVTAGQQDVAAAQSDAAAAATDAATRIADAEKALAAARQDGAREIAEARAGQATANSEAAKNLAVAQREFATAQRQAELARAAVEARRWDMQVTAGMRSELLKLGQAADVVGNRLAVAKDKLSEVLASEAGTAQSIRDSVKGANAGLFGFGDQRKTLTDVLRGAQVDVADSQRFRADLSRIRRSGGSEGLLQQLAEGGAEGRERAKLFATATPQWLRQYDRLMARADSTATLTGRETAAFIYRDQRAAAQTAVKQQEANVKLIQDTAAEIGRAVASELGSTMRVLTAEEAWVFVAKGQKARNRALGK